jgi:hypothetical protein
MLQVSRFIAGFGAGCLWAVGTAFGATLIVASTAGYIRHPLESFPEILIWATISMPAVGAILVGSILRPFRGAAWAAPLVAALVGVGLAVSCGQILAELLLRGSSDLRYSAVFSWAPAYAIALLPISFPIAFVLRLGLNRMKLPVMNRAKL